MKIKLALTFLVVAILLVWGIFYFKNYYSYDSLRKSNQSEKLNSEIGLKDVLNDSQVELFDYLDKPIQLKEKIFTQQELSSKKKQILSQDVQADSGKKNKSDEAKELQSQPQKIIMHFWASWCDPCVNEIPELIKYARTLQKSVQKSVGKGQTQTTNSGVATNTQVSAVTAGADGDSQGVANNTVATKLIVVNLDYELEDIQKFLKSFPELNKPPFIQVWDKKNYLSKSFKVDKLPMTLIWENFELSSAKSENSNEKNVNTENVNTETVNTENVNTETVNTENSRSGIGKSAEDISKTDKSVMTEKKPRRINGVADWAGM